MLYKGDGIGCEIIARCGIRYVGTCKNFLIGGVSYKTKANWILLIIPFLGFTARFVFLSGVSGSANYLFLF